MHARPLLAAPWLIVALLGLPGAAAGFGQEDARGWPIGEGGFAHDPAQRFDPSYLATLQPSADPLNKVGPATIYPYYPIVLAEVTRLAMEYPDLVRLHSGGTSTLGLDLWTLEIADFGREGADDFAPLPARERIWVDGGTHSNEYSGVYFVLAVAQYLIESYGSDDFATWVVQNRHTWIMPMLNPDGSHLMGRLNANLVNVNRNYPVLWGGDGTDMLLNNPGPSAGSEVETQASIRWYEEVQPDYMASIHCCGNLWLAPYGEEGYDPVDLQVFERVCDEAFPDVRDDCGPIWSTIYPASGSSVDTCYEFTGGVCYGYEMSGRSNLVGPWGEPVTLAEVFDQERESWQGLRHAFENVHLYGAHLVPGERWLDGDVVRMMLHNDGYGNATGIEGSRATSAGVQEFTLPDIPAGETVEVAIPWQGGPGTASIAYNKRIQAEPKAAFSWAVTAADIDDAGAAAMPLPLLVLVAGLGAALRARRRQAAK